MAKLTHNFHPPLAVVRQLLNGKSLSRSLFNLSLKSLPPLEGRILELGGKKGKSSYFNYLSIPDNTEIVKTDLVDSDGVIALNVEQTFPFENESFDYVIAFHLFEHVFDLNTAPSEMFRILNPGGKLIVSVPFIHEYHGDPYDYWRFTHKSVDKLLTDAGFSCLYLEAIGEGLLTYIGTRLPSIIFPPFIRASGSAMFYALLTGFDRLISRRPRIDGYTVPERFPLDILSVFEKPADGNL